ncbi:MAG: HAD hydrolase-like protein [Steroidobacteraceae bacterium]
MNIRPAFIFDLDGTLVDSVYQHVLAWQEALDEEGMQLSVWRIHRKIGMSGGLFARSAVADEKAGRQRDVTDADQLSAWPAKIMYGKRARAS